MPEDIVAVQCLTCKKLYEKDSESFISVHGNICIGIDGGIVGNNIKDDKIYRVSIYCYDCFIEHIKKKIPIITEGEVCSLCGYKDITVKRTMFDGMCASCTDKALNDDCLAKKAKLNNKNLKINWE